MTKRFISEPLRALFGDAEARSAGVLSNVEGEHGEPGLPSAFTWREETLAIKNVTKVWRSMKEDRGDQYLARHWYEIETADGRRITIYFDRHAKVGKPRWWLYSLEE